jgi:hypothetical protein
MMFVPITISDIHELNPLLAAVLASEVARGNLVIETWRGWPDLNTHCVRLERPFAHHVTMVVPPGLSYYLVDDMHHWYEELRLDGSGQMIVTTR